MQLFLELEIKHVITCFVRVNFWNEILLLVQCIATYNFRFPFEYKWFEQLNAVHFFERRVSHAHSSQV